jgi:hypothetical protein
LLPRKNWVVLASGRSLFQLKTSEKINRKLNFFWWSVNSQFDQIFHIALNFKKLINFEWFMTYVNS